MMNSKRNRRQSVVLAVLFVMMFSSFSFGQETDARPLLPNQTIERELSGAETHRYKFDLKANEFFQVTVEQKGIDVLLKILSAEGKILATMDSPNGNQGPETISFIALNESTSFILEIESFDREVQKANYTIERKKPRIATSIDRRRIMVERLFVEAIKAIEAKEPSETLRHKFEKALSGWQELGEEYLIDLTFKGLVPLTLPKFSDSYVQGVSLANVQDVGAAQKALVKFEEAKQEAKEEGSKLKEALATGWLAVINDSLGNKQKALDYYKETKSLYQTVGNKFGESISLISISGIYHYLDNKPEATNYLLQSIELKNEIGDLEGKANALMNLAAIYDQQGKKREAIEIYGKASDIFKTVRNKSGEANAIRFKGIVYSYIDLKKANEFILQSVKLAELIENNQYLGLFYNDLAISYENLDKPEKAIEYYLLALSRINDDKRFEAILSKKIGDLYTSLYSPGNKRKAIEYYERALPFFQNIGDKLTETEILSNMSQALLFIGEKAEALKVAEKAKKIAFEIRNKEVQIKVLILTGVTNFTLGKQKETAAQFDQAIEIAKTTVDIDEEYIRFLYGLKQMLSGESFDASENLLQALLTVNSKDDKPGQALILQYLGINYFGLEEYDKALENLQKALSHFQTSGDELNISLNNYITGLIYIEKNEQKNALNFLTQALLSFRHLETKENEASCLAGMMMAWSLRDDRQIAIFYGKQSVNKLQELRKSISSLDKKSQKAYLQNFEEAYKLLADLLIKEGRIAEAEQVLAMLKEEEYFSYLRRDDNVAADLRRRISLSPDEKKAFEHYEKYADEITRTTQEFGILEKKKNALPLGESLSAEDKKQYDLLKAKYDAAITVFNKFLDDLKVKFSENDKRVAVVESDTQGLLKKMNQSRTAIISTIVGENRLNLIVTTSDIQRAHTVEVKATDLNKLVTEFRSAVKDPSVDPRPLSKMLYDKLFPAALQKDLQNIKADTIIWSLDGTLRYVPVAALWDGEKYLVERYTTAVLTLASRDKLDRAVSTNRQNWQAFGVGVSKPFDTFNALPAVPKELCSVVDDPKKKDFCKTFGENGVFNGLMLSDEEFTLADFQNNLGKTPVVHIASHFSLNAGNETDSYLLLGGGKERRFSLDNLKKTRLDNIELLTLSACNTAMTSGSNSSGVEIEGFGALAQKQGAKTVLATLWAVADDSTGVLMTEFYRILETRPEIGKAEALRMAQLKMIRGKYESIEESLTRGVEIFGKDKSKEQPPFKKDDKAPFAHPYFWSPFVLIGNWK